MDIQELNKLLEIFHSYGWFDPRHSRKDQEQQLKEDRPNLQRREGRRYKEALSAHRTWKGGDIGPAIEHIRKYKTTALYDREVVEILSELNWAFNQLVEWGPDFREAAETIRGALQEIDKLLAIVPPSFGQLKKKATASAALTSFFVRKHMTGEYDGSLSEKAIDKLYQDATKEGIFKGKRSSFESRLKEHRSLVKKEVSAVKDKDEKKRKFLEEKRMEHFKEMKKQGIFDGEYEDFLMLPEADFRILAKKFTSQKK
ncbi:hypothetical protein MYX64_05370 [Nitrospinae bacterium AH_259_B05_G02_I21]|nr:hypothetical protein [Nitrospinae bacterium AH_259_B05_G02_I21]MDA2931714.1 hypothetical protein [Nitrospinae bacterium AH-259-F20]